MLSGSVLKWTADAENNSLFCVYGTPGVKGKDKRVTSAGWRSLQILGIAEGIVAITYVGASGTFGRVHQFLKCHLRRYISSKCMLTHYEIHLWSGSCANVTCPNTMTDSAASQVPNHAAAISLKMGLRSSDLA